MVYAEVVMILSQKDIRLLRQALTKTQDEMVARSKKNFILLDQGPVDDEPWYTIQIQNQDIWFWLTQQEGRWHHYHSEARRMPLVDMDEKMYVALTLSWS